MEGIFYFFCFGENSHRIETRIVHFWSCLELETWYFIHIFRKLLKIFTDFWAEIKCQIQAFEGNSMMNDFGLSFDLHIVTVSLGDFVPFTLDPKDYQKIRKYPPIRIS